VWNVTRDAMIRVRVSEAGVEQLDKARGQWTRSEYIRQALARAIKGGKTEPLRGPVTGQVDF